MSERLWADDVSIEEATAIATRMTDALIERVLAMPPGLESRVYEAMRYSALAPGKRLRPLLVLASAHLFGVARRSALQVAAAIEMVHAYSLIHDDLPAMDNSDLRRGRPTCHKQFDDATAILAGDGLLSMAFAVLADRDTHGDAAVRVELVAALAGGGGSGGHGRRPDDRPDSRDNAARHRCDHPPATHENGGADRVFMRGRRDSGQGAGRTADRIARLCP